MKTLSEVKFNTRLKVPLAKKNVYKKSFIPTAVSVLKAEF